MHNSKGTSINALKDGIIFVTTFTIITFVILYIMVKLNHKYLENKYRLSIKIKNKTYLIDASFGGRKDYFTYYGNYQIYDLYYAKDTGWIDKDYYEWWGFEDRKLFFFAKTELKKISKNEEPFNFTILTADTHFYDGYQDKRCKKEFDSDYANSYYCLDEMLNNFIKWIQKQSFYKNTTIIISGDHLTMQKEFFNEENYERTVYNTFINSQKTSNNYKNRSFTTLDMFPTTLAALGVEIEGDKLGLGTNLFSNDKTLIEKYDYNYVNQEINKKSFYYDNVILGNSYYEMKKK